jgi:hypothetical protein
MIETHVFKMFSPTVVASELRVISAIRRDVDEFCAHVG